MARDAPRWHPFFAAVEGPVGTWRMLDADDREYGLIRLVRLDGEPRYRAELRGELIGYGTTLRGACERVHHAFVVSHGPRPFQGYPVHDKTPPPTPRKG